MRILCFGDVFGPMGTRVVLKQIEHLKKKYNPHLIVVNAENSGLGGKSPSLEALRMLLTAGVHVITGGNHSFGNRELYDVYQTSKNILRPCNYPEDAPGIGSAVLHVPLSEDLSVPVGVINVQLRVFMRELLACPFKAVEGIVAQMRNRTSLIIVDVHGEATAEKVSFAYHFDGKVSLIFGTHTHIQTADERILPQGTGYITDIGSTSALHSSLGVKFSCTIKNFITQMPLKFEAEETGPFVTGALYAEINEKTGKTDKIERIMLVE